MSVEKTVVRRSIYRAASAEIKRFDKRNSGKYDNAHEEWNRKHWWGWARKRWLEHLRGKVYWIELGDNDFNVVGRALLPNGTLLEEILGKLYRGEENLDIINWAVGADGDMTDVLEILGKLDLNKRRDELRSVVP